jgi:hypothetical protein
VVSSKFGPLLVFEVALLVTLGSAGCDETVVERGALEFEGDRAPIDVPSAANVGEAFAVTVHTYGACHTFFESTEVSIEGQDTLIEPYDSRTVESDGACPRILNAIKHEVSLKFDTIGNETVRIRGRRVINGVSTDMEIPLTVSIH